MRKSLILHIDSLAVLEELEDEQAGQLFKAIYYWHIEREYTLDFAVKIAFLPFKNQFIRDGETYENICERNRINGLKGGRPKTQTNPENPDGLLETQDNPKNLKSKNKNNSKNDSDTVTDNNINIEFEEFWELYDKKKGHKEKVEKLWNKLTDEERDTAIKTIPLFKQSIKDKQFQPYPATYINQKRWNDELEPPEKKNKYNTLTDEDIKRRKEILMEND